ncbi:MAG TPA: long-chain-acyl-CoA synthetase [Candidatus Binataceae bacterium]|nr:long-chain-acyl-CoA synthetase [Candidatus Binataceae bacterium]
MNDPKFARQAWIRALERTAAIERDPECSMPLLVEQLAERFGMAPALVSRDGSLSYRALASRAHQYARWGLAQGLTAGDVAALLMPNRAEYLAVWLGLTRLGVKVALVNTNISGAALVHSISIVAPKLMIVDAALTPRVSAVRAQFATDLQCWVYGESSADFESLQPALARTAQGPIPAAEHRPPSLDATALYIYTSGTTGLPKAAHVSHYRLMRWSHWFAGLLDTSPEDRMYDCLPLYHSVGGIVATGATLVGGGAVVIRSRFSASEFWRDVREERCTLFQYIGELCRYLIHAPPQSRETEHNLRIACGNGLRPEVWETFRTRFRIAQILEYYASTEGNFSLYNCEGKPGAIGRMPSFLSHRLPVALVRFDVERGEPLRNAEGLCERCATGEAGEALGLIPDDDTVRAGRFEGYADREASAQKVLRDVFKEGDAWYRTGDLMRRDEQGFFYFVDRVGETFRWKGENVSTAEVLSALSAAAGVIDGVVYGVAVPGADGRAGMAALVVSRDFDLAVFRADIAARLPAYARPVFLRLLPALEATATFKPRKQDLFQAGFDPARITDPLYVDDSRVGAYLPLDVARRAAIIAGEVRL